MQSLGVRHLPLTHSEVGQSAKIEKKRFKVLAATYFFSLSKLYYVFRSKLLTIPRSNCTLVQHPYNFHFRIRGAEYKCRNSRLPIPLRKHNNPVTGIRRLRTQRHYDCKWVPNKAVVGRGLRPLSTPIGRSPFHYYHKCTS